jgi:hypothetical protein
MVWSSNPTSIACALRNSFLKSSWHHADAFYMRKTHCFSRLPNVDCRQSTPKKNEERFMDAISFTVNGKMQSVEVAPDTPLLWVLRDTLGLTGTKFGCGMSLCGACTVHVDGEATRSCVTRVSAVSGRNITTIEGLSLQGQSPVQSAWLDQQVAQCGYCQA